MAVETNEGLAPQMLLAQQVVADDRLSSKRGKGQLPAVVVIKRMIFRLGVVDFKLISKC